MASNGRRMNEFVLIPLHFNHQPILDSLKKSVAAFTNSNVSIVKQKIDFQSCYDDNRAQYDAVKIIQQFEKPSAPFTIVLTSVDLFIPIFTFVFGLAKLNGKVGIVSSHRLENRFYGLPKNPARLKERILKEIIHEMGHLKGLRHCPQFKCVMASSTAADELDIKDHFFCDLCLSKME